MVTADEIENGVIRCRVPRLDAGRAYVAISFDSEHFSEVSLPLKILPEPWIDTVLLFAILLFASVFGLVLIVVRKVTAPMVPRFDDRGSLVSRVAARHGFL
jgi:hypothetical protein